MFGKTTIQIKLVEGDSAGTVTAFYVRNWFFIFFINIQKKFKKKY